MSTQSPSSVDSPVTAKTSAVKRLTDLALFGGQPAFREPLHVGKPNFGEPARFLRRFEQILSSRRFTNDGPLVREFEDRIAALTGAQHAIATVNATIALQLLAHALELRGEIVMPAFTFVATAHAFAWVGIEPVFCDIDPLTHGVDARDADAVIGPKCSALVAVHTWGIPCDVTALEEIARKRGIPLLFDAAHAFACTHPNGPVGTCGTAEVFSFHATKFINSFEGGAVTTNDAALAERLRRLRDFGFAGYENVIMLGTNAKMSELHAAAGLTCLEALPSIVAANRRSHEHYRKRIADVPGLRMLDVDSKGASNYQYVVVELDPSSGVNRDDLVRALHAENIYARRYFHPGCHRSAPYAHRSAIPSLPATERVSSRVVALPTGPSIRADAIDTIVDVMDLVLRHPEEFRQRLLALP